MNIITNVSLVQGYITKYSKKLGILVFFAYDAVRMKETKKEITKERKKININEEQLYIHRRMIVFVPCT